MSDAVNSGLSMDHYTFPLDGVTRVVPVAEFRQAIEHLERKVRCDYGACVNNDERARWAVCTRIVGAELIGMTCKRATQEDWDRRERAIDRSADLLSRFI